MGTAESVFAPWEKTLLDRLALLKPGTVRIAYFSELPDPGSFRYRCYNMAQAVNSGSASHSASYFFLGDLPALSNLADYADVLVLSRVRYDSDVGRLIGDFRRVGKTVFSDLDDLIFSPKYATLVARSLDHPTYGEVLDSWFALLARVGETLRLSDQVITSTHHLAGLVATEFTGEVHVIPNFLNEEQLAISGPSEAAAPKSDDGCFVMGYFSGSNSHALDFGTVVPALAKIFTHHPAARLVLAGHIDLPRELEGWSDRISFLPFMNIPDLQGAMSAVDLNLVALQHNDFTFCKSELKFFEAAICAVPTIASATPVFDAAIVDGQNGWLVRDGDWHSALERIITLPKPELEKVGAEARKTALARFVPSAIFPEIERVCVSR